MPPASRSEAPRSDSAIQPPELTSASLAHKKTGRTYDSPTRSGQLCAMWSMIRYRMLPARA